MTIFGKPLDDLVGADLEALDGVREGPTVEFKQEMYKPGDGGNRELLRDIASMANAEGGVLILGVEEDAKGVARGLRNVLEADKASERLISCCTANIAERVPGLRARVVATTAGAILVVRIPRSYRRPHMITFQGAGEFWIRHDRQKSRMSIAEVRNAVAATEEAEVKVERFMEKRLAEHRTLTTGPGLICLSLTATPAVVEDGRVDIFDPRLAELLKNPPSYRSHGYASLSDHGARLRPTLHGIEALAGESHALHVFRNGQVDFMLTAADVLAHTHHDGPREDEKIRIINAFIVAELTRNFVHFVHALRTITSIEEPYWIQLAMWRCAGYYMDDGQERRFPLGRNLNAWDGERDLLVPPMLATLDESPDAVTRKIVDRFWNALHHPRCPFFDQDGRFHIPQG